MESISQCSLTKQLRELEDDNIISRTVYPEVSPKVIYALTEKGKRLNPYHRHGGKLRKEIWRAVKQ